MNVEDHIPSIVNQICFNINRSQSNQDSSGKLLPRGKSTANDAQLPSLGKIYIICYTQIKSPFKVGFKIFLSSNVESRKILAESLER